MNNDSNSTLDTVFALIGFAIFIIMIPSLLFGVIAFEMIRVVADINILKWSAGIIATGFGYYFWNEMYKPFMYEIKINPFFTYVIMYGLSIGGFYLVLLLFEPKNPLAILIVELWMLFYDWALGS